MKRNNTHRAGKILAVLLSVVLVLSLSLTLAGCGNTSNKDLKKLVVGATTTPHAEILNNLKDDLAKEGYDLVVIEYTDYVKLNPDTVNGDIIANFFQHQPYLDDFNTKNKANLVSVAAIHFEPLAIYQGKTRTLADLPNGATIAIPSDTTNEARALLLLQAQGLIKLPANAGLTVTPRDITDNPRNLKFVELEAAAIPAALADVNIGVINGNYALSAGLDSKTILAKEDPKSQAATTYANILVVKSGNEKDPGIQALSKALTSEKTRKFINDNYSGVVIPVF